MSTPSVPPGSSLLLALPDASPPASSTSSSSRPRRSTRTHSSRSQRSPATSPIPHPRPARPSTATSPSPQRTRPVPPPTRAANTPAPGAVDDLPPVVQAILFGLQASPATLDTVASRLREVDAVHPSVLRHISRADVDLLFPDQVAPRLLLLSLVARLAASAAEPLADAPLPPTPDSPAADWSASYESRGLTGLDSRLIPPASVLDEALRATGPGKSSLAYILDLPLSTFMPESPTSPSAPSGVAALLPHGFSSSGRDSNVRSSTSRASVRPGTFIAALLSWGIAALLRSPIPLAAVVGHWSWCARYLDWYGVYTAVLYDHQRRAAVAAAVRSGASVSAMELGAADAMLVVDCRAQIDRVLRARPSPQRPSSGKGKGRSTPYSTPSSTSSPASARQSAAAESRSK